jgi:hypothetical protein
MAELHYGKLKKEGGYMNKWAKLEVDERSGLVVYPKGLD